MKLRNSAKAVSLLTVGALCTTFTTHAQVYKCEVNGSVVYQEKPCDTGRGKELNTVPNTMDRMAPVRQGPAGTRTPAAGGGFDAVAKAQRNGMWEWVDVRKTGSRGYFCVSDSYKFDPRRSLPQSYGGTCNVPRDTVSGAHFELQVQCVLGSSGENEFGKMVMTMRGTATPTQIDISFFPQPSGNHSRLAVLGEQVRTETTERWTWIRPCGSDEKPGPQWIRPSDVPKPKQPSTSSELSPRVAAPDRRSEGLGLHEKVLYDLGDRSFVEAVGVFKADSASENNTIDIRVKRSSRPVILVLSSKEAVRWNVTLESGAELSAILLSGSSSQTIAGVTGVRVIELGTTSVYQDTQLPQLQRELTKKIGRPADRFQGQYAAKNFALGGKLEAVSNQDKYRLGEDSAVEMLGAYRLNSTEPVQVNIVDVRVQRSVRPVVLVLNSNAGVQWNISLDAGADLRAVFTAGNSAQSVAGVSGIRVTHLGLDKPYTADTRTFEKEVEQAIGRRIDKFPQKILGDKPRAFEVGGTK